MSNSPKKGAAKTMQVKRLRSGDERELEKAGPCFDRPIQADAATRFLESENHYMLVAYEHQAVAGFITGIETTHPDKGTEMFLYELGVAEEFRRKGIGTKLVNALAEIARARGCYGMWVLTAEDNVAALTTYGAAGAQRESTAVMLSWKFSTAPPNSR